MNELSYEDFSVHWAIEDEAEALSVVEGISLADATGLVEARWSETTRACYDRVDPSPLA